MRQTVTTFSLVVNLLGFILLAAASIGILSIMLVDVLGRSREIAIERALGASKMAIFKQFFTRSTIVSLMTLESSSRASSMAQISMTLKLNMAPRSSRGSQKYTDSLWVSSLITGLFYPRAQ